MPKSKYTCTVRRNTEGKIVIVASIPAAQLIANGLEILAPEEAAAESAAEAFACAIQGGCETQASTENIMATASVSVSPASADTAEWSKIIIDPRTLDRATFDAIEIHGVAALDEDVCEVDDDSPHFWSVFVHLVAGGTECIADFGLHSRAREFASDLAALHSCVFYDHARN